MPGTVWQNHTLTQAVHKTREKEGFILVCWTVKSRHIVMSTWGFYLLVVHKLKVSEDMGGTGWKCHQQVLWLPMAPTLRLQQDEILLLPAQGRESHLWALNLQWQWELVWLPALCPRDVPGYVFPCGGPGLYTAICYNCLVLIQHLYVFS